MKYEANHKMLGVKFEKESRKPDVSGVECEVWGGKMFTNELRVWHC